MLGCRVLERTRALQRLQATAAHAGRNNLYFTARGTEMCRSKVPLGPLMGRREEEGDDGTELYCSERESPIRYHIREMKILPKRREDEKGGD